MDNEIPKIANKRAIVKTVIIPIVVVIAIAAGVIVYIYSSKCPGQTDIIPVQEAANKAIDYINKVILGGQATVVLGETSEENGIYKIKFTLGDKEFSSYITRDSKLFFPEGFDLTESQPTPAVEEGITIGDFSISEDEICKKDGKPIIYFFGSKNCPHCTWEHPIIEKVAAKFQENIDFHNNMDSENDSEVFSKYSTGSIPTLVLGCKYYRVGSGERSGEEEETKNLTALICKLTDNKPADVCSQVQDLVNQIP